MTRQIHVANNSAFPFTAGWFRTTIDWLPDERRGQIGDVVYVVGSRAGKDLWHIDLRLSLDPGERKTIEFDHPAPPTPVVVPEPAGATPPLDLTIGEQPFVVVSAKQTGAGLDLVLRARVGPMLAFELWTTFYPGQPWLTGMLQPMCGNPDAPYMTGFVRDDLVLEMVGAVVTPAGQVLPEGMTLATGQGRPPIPVCIFIPGLSTDDEHSEPSAMAASQVRALGIQRIYPNGNPLWHPPGRTVAGWVATHAGPAAVAKQGWEPHEALSASRNANRTGAEGDNIFVGAALQFGAESIDAVNVLRDVAGLYAARPHHFLEADGSLLDYDAHSDLALYRGLPFGTTGSDLLGKPRVPSMAETHQWADWEEHDDVDVPFVAYRATGCPALQWQIQAQARKQLFSHGLTPGFSTTNRIGAQREWAWRCFLDYNLWHLLADGVEAQRIKDRYLHYAPIARARYSRLYWDAPNYDPRWARDTGRPRNWGAYQSAMAAYFWHLAAVEFNDGPSAAMAAGMALRIVDECYVAEGTYWRGWDLIGLEPDGTLSPRVEGNGAHHGSGTVNWLHLATAVVLHYEPAHTKARQIADQAIREAGFEGKFLPPELLGAEVPPA
ncbi:MAG: hypothetical protein E4H17_03235 [Gemmatimonadales bacterium]|nr:MAG: hypothetical protein E4H17_03235 [Gemmatimonadales bacterium]